MANYAKVVDSIVTKVIVAEAEFFDTFIDSSPGEWVEITSGGVGFTYDSARNAFVEPKIFSSWVLNEATNQWEAPVNYPAEDGKRYDWNEDTTAWVEIV